jgi:hypothetical protein
MVPYLMFCGFSWLKSGTLFPYQNSFSSSWMMPCYGNCMLALILAGPCYLRALFFLCCVTWRFFSFRVWHSANSPLWIAAWKKLSMLNTTRPKHVWCRTDYQWGSGEERLQCSDITLHHDSKTVCTQKLISIGFIEIRLVFITKINFWIFLKFIFFEV